MNNDIKYIIKRVIVGVLIGVILFSIKSCDVKALEVGPSGYYLPDNAIFYNNISTTNSVAVSTTFNGEDYENIDMITTVPNANGGNGASICIATPYTLVNGYIYSISILMANNHAASYNIVTKDNYTFVRAGYSAQDAANRLGSTTIQYFNSNYVPNLGYGPAYALGYMITIVGGNYNYVCLPFTTNQTFDSTHALYGVLFEQVGNSNEVTQNQLNSAMSNINSSIVSVNNTIAAGNAAIQADITNQSNFLQSILNGKILEVIQNQEQNTQDIIEEQQNTTDAVNDLNDTMTDSSTDSPNSGINAVKNGLASNGVITQLITLPVTLFQQILSSINGTCQTFNLGSLFGTDLTLPCINVSNYLGSTLWGIIDVIISGYFVWVIARKMISAFEMFSAMKDGDVLDD